MNKPRKVVFNYIFYNFCYICSSDTSVIHRLEYHFSSSIATIFIPFPLFRTVVKILKFLFYIINLIFYRIFHLFSDFNLHFNFFILYYILITLKPFLILPIMSECCPYDCAFVSSRHVPSPCYV